MLQSLFRPLSFGELLDRSFRLYRQHFLKFILLTLVAFGPVYFLYSLIFSETMGTSLESLRFFGDNYVLDYTSSIESTEPTISLYVAVALLILMPIMMLVIIPVVFSAVTHMVGSIYNHREPKIGAALKQSFSRWGQLLANTLLYGLVIGGVYLVVVIALFVVILFFSLVIGIGMGIAAWTGPGFSPVLIFIGIILYIAFIIGISCLVGFFLFRLGFFIPVVALEGQGIGMGRSWHLTKGNFWRGFMSFTVMGIVTSSLFTGNTLIVQMMVPGVFLKVLFSVVLGILVMPVVLILYSVSYFDMRTRHEGLDLQAMLYELKNNKAGDFVPAASRDIPVDE